jgi:methionyl-tRNA formyltransferase
MNPKIIFLGNTKYSLIGADVINKEFPISLVVTKPDSPTKDWALKNNVQFLEITSFGENIIQELAQLEPDFLIVEDFGLILPNELLKIPKVDSLNVHHSLLPKYRGAAPAPFALLNGDEVTGVSIISMTEEVDAGDILSQTEYKVEKDDTTDSLLTKLNKRGGELMVEVLKDYMEEKVNKTPQDPSKVVLTRRLTKEDGYFEIDNPPTPEELDRMIRAYYPWPNVWTRWNGKVVKLYPGGQIQMEGKKITKLEDFLRGYPEFPLKQL